MMGYRQRVKPDYSIIESFIPDGASVLDLGCGDGHLLKNLIDRKKISGMGIDFFGDGLNKAMEKKLAVLQLDLNQGLNSFKDSSFDFVVLNMTLQSIYHPLPLVLDMIRVGKKAIVGFPNFGYWRLLFQIAATGRMPKSKTLPYEWYDTPNIRLMTIKDFRILCRENQVKIMAEKFLDDSGRRVIGPFINRRAAEAVFLLEKIG